MGKQITRLEVIRDKRIFHIEGLGNVKQVLQDDGRTLKIFIEDKKPTKTRTK